MRNRTVQFATIFALALLAVPAAFSFPAPFESSAEYQPLQQRGQGAARKAAPVQPPPGKHFGRNPQAESELPPHWLERLRELPPAQQERFLQNNWRFRNLPPDVQERVRANLRRWNSLSPEEREEIRHRERVWRQLTPEQRQQVRESILPRWQQLTPERRQALLRRLRALRALQERERAHLLASKEFLADLSEAEQSLLLELARLRISPPEPVP
ncbi:MAG: DUF3106 domain-containing protein [Firmicutes bacterium]|nr:DUF3106 domain-containing protein [Bacillota bacterium]